MLVRFMVFMTLFEGNGSMEFFSMSVIIVGVVF